MNLSFDTRTFSLANLWFLLLLFSFSYDKPLYYLTSIDRFNPRLYDVATILGLFWILREREIIQVFNPIFQKYKHLIIWFGVCTVLGILIYSFPASIAGYSFFYLFKYFQELFLCFLVIQYLSRYELNYEAFFKTLIAGGIFVSIYCLIEYLNSNTSGLIEIAPGKTIYKPTGLVWGPFTASYFQIANYSPIVGFIASCYAFSRKGIARYFYFVASLFIFWPSFVSGSRTALGFILLLFILASIKERKFQFLLILFASSCTVLFLANPEYFLGLVLNSESSTIERMMRFETGGGPEFNSVEGRMNSLFDWFGKVHLYQFGGSILPFFGGGFYVAPMKDFFRIGYGWHNIFIFAVEQAGIVGLILFLRFIRKTWKVLKVKFNGLQEKDIEYWLVFSVGIVFLSILVLGMAGAHTFWNGFSTGNFNSFRLILLIIAAGPWITPSLERIENKT